ncbi:MAG: cobalamin-independent methionine synthase II family protein [Chloroflexi bacterium]|nr:cobalamin-independent methionine synthase II family protein [Chloroflexota bacterium]MBV9134047.1 cobalamin-independent methionine synthase II family protein [Chloroflexota bacterium]
MRHSTDRILVSHAGNLPRPEYLDELIAGGRSREGSQRQEYHQRLPKAITYIVDRQIELGIDIVNDGEYAKAGSYGGYWPERVEGYSTVPADPNRKPKRAGTAERDRALFPGFYASGLWYSGSGGPIRPGFATPGEVRQIQSRETRACTAPIKYIGQQAVAEDVKNLKAALQGKDVEGCITSLGPLSGGAGIHNLHYKSEEEYMKAVADACHEEYKAITDGGLILQVDEPEFCTTYSFYPEWSIDDLRKYLSGAVELINYALRDIPQEQVRFHTCWGSGHRPHVTDIELRHIADLLVKLNVQGISVEAANVRHEHEWKVWKDVKLRDGQILMPGVISHATDLVEHPDLVAERLVNYASVVGKENVQTGTDCGIGSRVGHEEIVWAKLEAMAEGARRASKQLWG